jgi:hypothetical protein
MHDHNHHGMRANCHKQQLILSLHQFLRMVKCKLNSVALPYVHAILTGIIRLTLSRTPRLQCHSKQFSFAVFFRKVVLHHHTTVCEIQFGFIQINSVIPEFEKAKGMNTTTSDKKTITAILGHVHACPCGRIVWKLATHDHPASDDQASTSCIQDSRAGN